MKVIQIGKMFPPPFGGIETVIASLAQGFSGNPRVAMEVYAAHSARGREASSRSYMGTNIHEFPIIGTFARTPIAPNLLRAAMDAKPDLLHFHFPYPWVESLQALAGSKIPYIVTYHADIGRFRTLYALYKPLMRHFLNKAKTIVVGTENHISSSPVLSGPLAGKCRIIPFGMDLEPFRCTPELTQAGQALRQSLSPDRPLILFIGRLVKYKGVSTLLQAMPHVNATLAILGTGPLASDLRAESEALGISNKVRWIGNVPLEALAAHYHAADVFVLPSDLPGEAFGLVQVEAHASGLPVICCDLPTGVTRVNLHQVTGLVVPMRNPQAMAEAINTLLLNESLRHRLGLQAKERAYRDFTIPTMCARYQAVYEEILGRNS